MSAVALTLVIPTRDRVDRLTETLKALKGQHPRDRFEVIVVDDGSQAGTLEALAALPRHFPCRWLRQGRRGPAAARNLGIAEARGERVLLLGDDTRPAPGALAAHLPGVDGARSGTPLGIQGSIDWDPQQAITPVMDFLAPEGPQFYFKGLAEGAEVPFTAVLGSNFSAPRRWFLEEPFDEGFPHAALEDTELAWRFARRGWRTEYAPDALCWHHHHYSRLSPFLARQRRAGASARYAVRLHPRLFTPLVLHPTLFGFAVAGRATLRCLAGHGQRQDLWDLASRGAFLRGFLFGGD